ncbi:hypothetical protein EHM76_04465 [bacterium]|nr:MAG: hypothetical protein EHM76_04465 [bacterium]
MKQISVTLDIPAGEGKPDYKHTYTKDKAETTADVQAISKTCADAEKKETPGDYLVKAFNYGHDLLLRAAERSKGSKLVQGPDKEIAKAVAMLVANGFGEAQAREMIIAQRKLTDKPV